ncbi:Uncharacterized protein K02A2.6 [Araneus ventricosus]|uniref:Uncharacterized protein K02A2.6 n=1 Tax=Araneus ventricosus TaxID=182803 RepID=A0A4Y2C2Y0_ARAVE|nr:Uncharacterized protein K02A2.6 [Araneus ventricosus]
MKKKVDVAIDKLLDQRVLEPTSNPKWSTPIVSIIKQSGEIRLCADYKETINKVMENNPYPMPSANHILANLADGKFFSKIYLAQAYLQLRVDDASVESQTIIMHRRAFKVNRLQFGVNVALGLFQNFMDDLLKGIPGVSPYFDDVLISEATEEKLFSCFLKDKASIAEPLHRLLEKNTEWKLTPDHEKAFAAVKELLPSDSVLVPFNEKLPLILACDATPYGPNCIPGTIIEKTGLLSYETVTPDGKSIRCHLDQMGSRKTPTVTSQFSPETPENSTISAASSAISSSLNTPIKLSDPPAEIETPKKAPDKSHQS